MTEFNDREDAWEQGALGQSEDHAEVVELSLEEEKAIDEAIGLQMISIRLQKSLIEDFKFIAEIHGLGYQTLMRQILCRFAESEKKRLLQEAAVAMRDRKRA
jgi:hypothetical protein